MTEWAGTTAVLLSLHEVMTDRFRRLRGNLPDVMEPQGPALNLFEGVQGTGGVGANVAIIASHDDGRQLSWLVEIWIDRDPDGDWYATVKGEIDLDDEQGE